ncbi:MAG: hypothetical protein HY721_01835 [Planctomycetes bacterium]|nr:hypothetical protein [Planctomycetota bacterium]
MLALVLLATAGAARAGEGLLDLTRARVVFPEAASTRERKAVEMLVDEVEERSGVRWPASSAWPPEAGPVVVAGREGTLGELVARLGAAAAGEAGDRRPEGYRIAVEGAAPQPFVLVAGNDERGVLFGIGRLLRILRIARGTVAIPSGFRAATAPRYPLRGHQLGYRPKTNSYDGWSLPLWEQYIRDLAVFGANAVELIPPRSDDDADSPHFPLPPMDMMRGMSGLLDAYGLDVWIWYPAMDADYADPQAVERALAEWEDVFRRLPRVDAVFVPGGDPGHTRPKVLLAFLEKVAPALRRHHPRAEMWLSPQSFSKEWLEELLGILKAEEPGWLEGLVYGPQVRGSLAELRAAVPARYPIRHYPDITHTRQCQFPVPDWDVAYAVTEGREPINPRPEAQARIFRSTQEHTVGFITYSEGCSDDANKAVWSALGWDPGASVREILRDYSRCFLGEAYAESFAEGLLDLERNWLGPLLSNTGVYGTLERFQGMECAASPRDLLNWRLQQGLYRAYYDAYVRSRLLHETALHDEAMASLRGVRATGSAAALARAEAALQRIASERVAEDWRGRVFELAEALFQSARMQLSVERYKAISVGRGANLDTIDVPLVPVKWLRGQLAEVRGLPGEAERLRAIDALLRRTDPGPGGFYDDLGDPARQPHLVKGPGFDADPALLESASIGFANDLDGPVAWWHHAQSLQDAPLRMRYAGLDPAARYKVRVVYGGETPLQRIRLVAGDGIEVHPLMAKPHPVRPIEIDLPPEATASGELILTWTRAPGLGGNGRGCQVSEVWVVRR